MLGLLRSPVAHAQAVGSPPDSAYWYVGAQPGLYQHVYITDGQGRGVVTVAGEAYAGYQLHRRLAVQGGLRYGRSVPAAEHLSGSGQYSNYPEQQYVTRATTVAVQARYRLARKPHRFQLEAVAGASLCFFTFRYVPFRREIEPRREVDTPGTDGFLDFGFGSHLRLSSRLALVSDLLLNLNIRHPNNFYFPIAPGYGVALGLNYRL